MALHLERPWQLPSPLMLITPFYGLSFMEFLVGSTYSIMFCLKYKIRSRLLGLGIPLMSFGTG